MEASRVCLLPSIAHRKMQRCPFSESDMLLCRKQTLKGAPSQGGKRGGGGVPGLEHNTKNKWSAPATVFMNAGVILRKRDSSPAINSWSAGWGAGVPVRGGGYLPQEGQQSCHEILVCLVGLYAVVFPNAGALPAVKLQATGALIVYRGQGDDLRLLHLAHPCRMLLVGLQPKKNMGGGGGEGRGAGQEVYCMGLRCPNTSQPCHSVDCLRLLCCCALFKCHLDHSAKQ